LNFRSVVLPGNGGAKAMQDPAAQAAGDPAPGAERDGA
jgi:hypothetical protein